MVRKARAGRRSVVVVLMGVLVLAGSGAATGRAATLRWKFQPGETLHYVMDQKVVSSVKGGPQDVMTTITQKIDLDWAIKEVSSAGVASMTQTVTRVRTKIESAFGAFEYDSKSGEEPKGPGVTGLVNMLKALLGAEFTFKMNPTGELSDVKVPEKVVQALREGGAAGAAGGMFSEEGMKNLVTESSLALPPEDLAKGKSWNRQTKLPMPLIGEMILDKVYSYAGPDPQAGPDIERIDLATKIELKTNPGGNIEVKINNQEGKGSFFFDNKVGRISRSSVTEKLELVFKLEGKEIIQNNETTTSMDLAKGQEAAAGTTK